MRRIEITQAIQLARDAQVDQAEIATEVRFIQRESNGYEIWFADHDAPIGEVHAAFFVRDDGRVSSRAGVEEWRYAHNLTPKQAEAIETFVDAITGNSHEN